MRSALHYPASISTSSGDFGESGFVQRAEGLRRRLEPVHIVEPVQVAVKRRDRDLLATWFSPLDPESIEEFPENIAPAKRSWYFRALHSKLHAFGNCSRYAAAVPVILMSSVPARINSVEQLRSLLPKTAPEALGVEVVSANVDGILLRMPMSDRARQPMGLLHGGVSMVLAESAASLHACWGLDLSHFVPVGIEINGSHIRSASDGHILAKATIIRRSSKFAVHNVEIAHEETGRTLCLARVTNFYKAMQVGLQK